MDDPTHPVVKTTPDPPLFFSLNANPSSCSGRFLQRAISSNPILAAPQFNLFATAIFA